MQSEMKKKVIKIGQEIQYFVVLIITLLIFFRIGRIILLLGKCKTILCLLATLASISVLLIGLVFLVIFNWFSIWMLEKD